MEKIKINETVITTSANTVPDSHESCAYAKARTEYD